jgi:hypothetical protein
MSEVVKVYVKLFNQKYPKYIIHQLSMAIKSVAQMKGLIHNIAHISCRLVLTHPMSKSSGKHFKQKKKCSFQYTHRFIYSLKRNFQLELIFWIKFQPHYSEVHYINEK